MFSKQILLSAGGTSEYKYSITGMFGETEGAEADPCELGREFKMKGDKNENFQTWQYKKMSLYRHCGE